VEERDGVVGEELVFSSGELEVVSDVLVGFPGVHAFELVAQRDPLVERRERAEPQAAAQLRLADQDSGERGGGVHHPRPRAPIPSAPKDHLGEVEPAGVEEGREQRVGAPASPADRPADAQRRDRASLPDPARV